LWERPQLGIENIREWLKEFENDQYVRGPQKRRLQCPLSETPDANGSLRKSSMERMQHKPSAGGFKREAGSI
jgi:hypothetical protein